MRVSRGPTTFSPCPALSCSHTHTDSRSLSHVRSHTGYLMHDILLSHIFAHCHASKHSHTIYTTLPCPHIVSRSHWLALFRSTLPHSATLPFVWLSHWFGITLCRSRSALLSHAPCTVTLSRSHDRYHTDTRFVSYCRTLAHDRDLTCCLYDRWSVLSHAVLTTRHHWLGRSGSSVPAETH